MNTCIGLQFDVKTLSLHYPPISLSSSQNCQYVMISCPCSELNWVLFTLVWSLLWPIRGCTRSKRLTLNLIGLKDHVCICWLIDASRGWWCCTLVHAVTASRRHTSQRTCRVKLLRNPSGLWMEEREWHLVAISVLNRFKLSHSMVEAALTRFPSVDLLRFHHMTWKVTS